MIPDPRLAVVIAIISSVLFQWALSASIVIALVLGIALIIAIIFYIGGYEIMMKRFVATVKQIDRWLDNACIYLWNN